MEHVVNAVGIDADRSAGRAGSRFLLRHSFRIIDRVAAALTYILVGERRRIAARLGRFGKVNAGLDSDDVRRVGDRFVQAAVVPRRAVAVASHCPRGCRMAETVAASRALQ